ncbi:cytochrome d ubiquinol oxidase subunit II [Salmonella enterica subsp. enterica serovar Infantis]|nr:cytochrome d ubiquinol oxidase subunit II [Salmonella enterica subsp. enterica serovar Infantis]
MTIDLPVIWFAIIVFATLMYIVMDGFDLGVGILFPFIRDKHDRDVMVNSVAPVWDGNETWLVLGGAGLFGAFPLAYAVITDALTIPLVVMLLGLIFRGVAFEFRFKATESHRAFWDKSFIVGSILATFAQGVVVGAVVSGFQVEGRTFSGSQLDWLTPFNLFCGVGLVVTYALLGATWLIMKSEDPLHSRIGLIFLGFSGLGISIWPNIIPPDISLYAAAAPPQSQSFMLVGALIIIPIILAYTFWSYYVFRGKVRHGEGYH